ncbi:transposase protein [Holotrichia oblita]|uniref:Transposase protein n=1 Tax=Holotrichia oblita TaxID=644536 RepID=A0ACB9SII3_HOLOL|nr:transposase protein [Holotrichia oblita]
MMAAEETASAVERSTSHTAGIYTRGKSTPSPIEHVDVSANYVSSIPTQTPRSATSSTPRKEKLRHKLKEARRLNIKTRKLLESQRKTLTPEDFYRCCDKFLPKAMAKFVKVQSQLVKTKSKGRRYNMEYKELALTLYFLGPRAYKFLEKLFCLPTKRSLERMTEKLMCLPGLNNDTLVYQLENENRFTVVDALVTDMGSNFVQLANILGVTCERPSFSVDGTEVAYLFDTPHLLEATRNNLLKNHFVFDQDTKKPHHGST